jgi:hypothetical protein
MMGNTLWALLRAISGGGGGRWCRSCSESIVPDDPFGLSEGVCRPCRGSA